MKIRLLKNREIDKNKWDSLVFKKGHGRMYALSQYLDAVSKDWNALVYDDYKMIMPLPIKRKWTGQFRNYIPLFVQQLGIIGQKESDNQLKDQFIRTASELYPDFIHSFNHENGQITFNGFQNIIRTNFEMELTDSYENISQEYSNNLSRNLKKGSALDLEFRSATKFQLLEEFIRGHSLPNDPTPGHIQTIRNITAINFDGFNPEIYSVWHGGQPLAVCLAPSFGNRITLLIPRSSKEGRLNNAMAFLIDALIRRNLGNNMILDFEGSMLEGVAQFYKGFGAKDKNYTLLQQ